MSENNEKNSYVVTGAFGYTGKYITRLLLEKDNNAKIRVLTGHPERPNPFGRSLEVVPFHFEDPDRLVDDLRGVKTVFNTYWVRFNHSGISFYQAVSNVQNLIRAAARAGVERFVHVSITNPSLESKLPYFRGKAIMEETLIKSGLSYAIMRPTLVFGKEDVLINNISWLLRRFPFYVVFGDGEYRVQPVYVDDVAKLAVELSEKNENTVVDAIGAETYTFKGLVKLLRKRTNSKCKIIHANPKTVYSLSKILNVFVKDIIVTREEIKGLMDETLVSFSQPNCKTSFSEWTRKNAALLGVEYTSELDRHFRRSTFREPLTALLDS